MADTRTIQRRLTAKQEAFIEAFLTNGENATEAYRQAYECKGTMADKTIREAASRLVKNSNVAARIQQHRSNLTARFNVTIDNLVDEYMKNLAQARKLGMPAAANSALSGMAKLFGLEKQKSEVEHKGQIIVVTGVPDGDD